MERLSSKVRWVCPALRSNRTSRFSSFPSFAPVANSDRLAVRFASVSQKKPAVMEWEMLNKLMGWLFGRNKSVVADDRRPIPNSAPMRTKPKNESPWKGRIRVPLKGNGSFSFDIVGEASYQDALEAIAGKKTRDGKELRCVAQVSPEPTNAHDSNAIAVEIDGRKVGYFSKADAKDYAGQLKEIGGGTDKIAAMIVGGFKSKTREGHFGVKLDITRHS